MPPNFPERPAPSVLAARRLTASVRAVFLVVIVPEKMCGWDGSIWALAKQPFFNLREKFVEPLFCTIHFSFVKLYLSL